jgi:hypothetical protein
MRRTGLSVSALKRKNSSTAEPEPTTATTTTKGQATTTVPQSRVTPKQPQQQQQRQTKLQKDDKSTTARQNRPTPPPPLPRVAVQTTTPTKAAATPTTQKRQVMGSQPSPNGVVPKKQNIAVAPSSGPPSLATNWVVPAATSVPSPHIQPHTQPSVPSKTPKTTSASFTVTPPTQPAPIADVVNNPIITSVATQVTVSVEAAFLFQDDAKNQWGFVYPHCSPAWATHVCAAMSNARINEC